MTDAADTTEGSDDAETYTCEFVEEGVEIEVAEDEYILEAALDEDIELQYSCLQGVCASCSAKVEGDIEQGEERVLTQWEKQQGYGLLCVAYPRSDLTIHSNEEP
ncbi:MAG: 2Fe-2S iron-sulfur cluster-binding protein [Halobacteriaceae archaeon]